LFINLASNKTIVLAKEKNSNTLTNKEVTVLSTSSLVKEKAAGFSLVFQLRFSTQFGQNIYVVGNHPLLGNNNIEKAIPLTYCNKHSWKLSISFAAKDLVNEKVSYQYFIKNVDGTISYDWGGNDKSFNPSTIKSSALLFVDSWNAVGYCENAFYTEPFKNVLLKNSFAPIEVAKPELVTHQLKVKSPLLTPTQTICLLGDTKHLHAWDATNPILLSRKEGEDYFSVFVDLSKATFPIVYKYGIYDVVKKAFVVFENGNNRALVEAPSKDTLIVVNDGFTYLPNNTWKGAGVAIPVFSLRSTTGLGVGEFTDIKLLVDWAKKVGLKKVQLLPINDTTATHSWKDSYPYAAISAFALHPLYIHLDNLIPASNKILNESLLNAKEKLNELLVVDYEAVAKIKYDILDEIYAAIGATTLASKGFKDFFAVHNHWLEPYAAFCYCRDQFGTVDFNAWPKHNTYSESDFKSLLNSDSSVKLVVEKYYFIQYQLDVQLREATAYAHENGVIVKGDIAIGVYRYGVDAWQHPGLFHLDMQAGAPPDDFAVAGQNWGFPTYNWEEMTTNGFAWWKQRFEQMSLYFDAFRIDHILGFFRIWSIPMEAVEGILGHFVPAIPVHVNELQNRGIHIDVSVYAKPVITDRALWDYFGYDNEVVKAEFLTYDGYGKYTLKPAFTTQRLVEKHFAALTSNDYHKKIKHGLFNLISNVIFIEAKEPRYVGGQFYHFRFGMENTAAFKGLDHSVQHQLKELYVDYFFRRQDDFWKKEALNKLPALKRVTNMLVCGEDLGFVPSCLPDVMHQLGLLSLEIQRMPKDSHTQFFHPKDAPYLSVVTPSTHDMSTLRGWWEENAQQTQAFYNQILGQSGKAPQFCEADINKAIIMQHLYSPAMWSTFQLQDLLGIDANLRRQNPLEERINIPANPTHYWQYRMHITLEALIQQAAFNAELHNCIVSSGRA
jgi:4-alpha-glucanotransferase